MTLAPIFEKAQKEMLDVMNDAEMSEEEKFDKYADILGSMTDDALAQQDRVNALLSKVEETVDQGGREHDADRTGRSDTDRDAGFVLARRRSRDLHSDSFGEHG